MVQSISAIRSQEKMLREIDRFIQEAKKIIDVEEVYLFGSRAITATRAMLIS